MKQLFLILLFTTFLLPLAAQSAGEPTAHLPKHEVRAAWLTTLYGLDWPRSQATTREGVRKQKAELIEILDRLKAANFNTVLFQARTRGDVFYRSKIEPFNSILTGKTGGDPGYDPLAFAIEECHKRGMECHAWMVSIPLGNRKHVASLGKTSVTKRKSAICVPYKQEYFLNPGHPQTKEYLMSLVREIIENYDVDGVHFDYLRYPENALRFPDTYDFRKYANGRNLAQWRRDNITEIIRYIYNKVKLLKPWVKVSTSPIGKYRDTSRYSSRGWNAFHTVYQDVQGWLGEGIQDQIYPMVYFRGNHFYPFVLDWQEQSNGRQVVPGLGIYFLDPSEGDWTLDEIERQMYFIRAHRLAGEAHFRTKYLMDNTQGVYDVLEGRFYIAPALQPAMPWIDNLPPAAPGRLTVAPQTGGYIHLSWTPATDNDTRNAPTYVVYGSNAYPVDTSNPENIIAQRVQGTEHIYAPILPWNTKKYFAVTAVDRCGNESEACSEAELRNFEL
ncbi:glycoside hydrolase family 10 protein [Bacteroides sp. UBA939]|uniref:glycoside hydrolase family 10 protein n=1 Tax=Bacteroides sp. UBA939 TaxID=1946092 RepID=UPI0025B844A3|nr:family 10 glycosylhydrolase [Bacteroides sp. UBA939]